ncbi:hypothetical protein M0G74_01050 [Microbulbifer sp. CAU 1566]|uniref:hypothetical protein n=1 Tax=Microbulbifer sp. CAU 1566 TaxID=2933269 RepID=UPI002003D924|nr:hypothetical protein [Microbulbifer sp. CAU 1566]MCK7595851.1 hypothetical protein [Microbulbifer sp. CAU 1566]
MCIKKYTEEELNKLKDKTDYETVGNLTEEEIEEGSKNDPDSLTPTDVNLKKFKKVRK